MKKFGRWFACFIYIVVVAAVCIYALFPEEAAKRYLTAKLGNVHRDIAITIEGVRPIFPPGVGLRDVVFEYKGQPVFAANEIRVIPRLISLLGKLKKFYFQIDAHDGMIKGQAEMNGLQPGSRIAVNAAAADIRIERVPFFKDFLQHDVEGRLGGDFVYAMGPPSGAILQARIDIKDLVVAMVIPGFNLDRLAFERVHADIRSDTDRIDVPELTLYGQKMEGKLSGEGTLSQNLWESTIELKGTLQPKLDRFQNPTQASSNTAAAEVDIEAMTLPITLYGPLNNLRFQMK